MEVEIKTREALTHLVELGHCIVYKRVHFYKNGPDKYNLLFFDDKSNLSSDKDQTFKTLNEATDTFMKVTGPIPEEAQTKE